MSVSLQAGSGQAYDTAHCQDIENPILVRISSLLPNVHSRQHGRVVCRLPNFVKTLHAEGDRIFVGDLQESFHYMRYKKADNALYVYADDIVPRHLTSALPLDYDTVAGADKFGNVVVTRLPAAVSAQVSSWSCTATAAASTRAGAEKLPSGLAANHSTSMRIKAAN